MTDTDLRRALQTAIEAARSGAAELESWRNRFHIREKAPADLVTDADTASQKAVKDHLLNRFPDHHFLGEEDAFGKTIESLRFPATAPPTWVCDPLDGTCNYAHGLPQYAVNIALVVNGETLIGVTFDPRLNELFTATKGGGAFLNGEPIHVSAIAQLKHAMLVTGFPSDYERQLHNFAVWQKLAKHSQSLRRTCSTALNLAYVACGRFDGYWCFDNWPWDVLPGVLMVREAGGRIMNATGGEFDPFHMDVLGSNALIHDEALQAIR